MKILRPTLLATALAVSASPGTASEPTPVADLMRNTKATVAGTVDRVTAEDEFVLADATGQFRIFVSASGVPVAPGETITVTGHVAESLRLEMTAATIVRADGTTFTFDRND